MLYCEAWYRKNPEIKITPSIYKIRKMTGKPYNDRLIIKEGRSESAVDDYRHVRDQFITGLTGVTERVFSNEEPFTMTKELTKCRYCPYSSLCFR